MTCRHVPYVGPGGRRQCAKCGEAVPEPVNEARTLTPEQTEWLLDRSWTVPDEVQEQRLARYGAGRPVDESDA